jgi:hypothetical protein
MRIRDIKNCAQSQSNERGLEFRQANTIIELTIQHLEYLRFLPHLTNIKQFVIKYIYALTIHPFLLFWVRSR